MYISNSVSKETFILSNLKKKNWSLGLQIGSSLFAWWGALSYGVKCVISWQQEDAMQWCGNSELYQSEPCTHLYTSPGLHFKRVSRSGLIWQCMAHAGCQPLWLLCGKARNPGPIMSVMCTCTCKGTAWKGKENTVTIYSSRLALLLTYNCHLPVFAGPIKLSVKSICSQYAGYYC